ncbi:MAG TPA: DUF554 domain-containing protein [Spirochaetia bacterium]|nr:DUF554 domain-containing protein [Spirochaetia bacterium]
MIATFINCAAVIVGALIGFFFHKKISESMKTVVYIGAGLIAFVLGLKMAFEGNRIVFLAFSLILGGILGEWWNIEGGILSFGAFLKKRFSPGDSEKDFSYAYLDASVIFCVGAMTLVGAFKAGAEGNYELILTKSVLDGFMAIILSAAMGIGVAFSALTILIYQGGLTLLSGLIQPYMSAPLLAELTGIGGTLVIMIGLNLLGLSKIKTANFLPAILLILVFLGVESAIPPGFLKF